MGIPLGGQLPLDQELWQELSTLQARLAGPAGSGRMHGFLCADPSLHARKLLSSLPCAAANLAGAQASRAGPRRRLPTVLARCSPRPRLCLQNLNLYGTGLTGLLPSNIALLTNLQFLSLGKNEFEGEPPGCPAASTSPGLRSMGRADRPRYTMGQPASFSCNRTCTPLPSPRRLPAGVLERPVGAAGPGPV